MTDKQLQAIVDALQNQRNDALNNFVKVECEKAALEEQLEAAQKEIEELKAKLETIPETTANTT